MEKPKETSVYKRFKIELKEFLDLYLARCDLNEEKSIAEGYDNMGWQKVWCERNKYWYCLPSDIEPFYYAIGDTGHPLTKLAKRYIRLAARRREREFRMKYGIKL